MFPFSQCKSNFITINPPLTGRKQINLAGLDLIFELKEQKVSIYFKKFLTFSLERVPSLSKIFFVLLNFLERCVWGGVVCLVGVFWFVLSLIA